MSATRESTHAGPHDLGDAESDRCAQCNAPLSEDQEWCLECGASRTLIYTPPDWRMPVAVVLLVAALAVAGFAFAVTRLSDRAGRTAAAHVSAALPPAPAVHRPRHRTTAAATPTTSTGASTTANGTTTPTTGATTPTTVTTTSVAGHAIATWPVGLSGWTVILGKYATEAQAYARARQIAPTGLPVGVIDSNQHPALQPGVWIVFSSRYPDHASARAAVFRLIAGGYTTARARQVAPPGGL